MMHKCKEMGLYNVVQIFPSVFYCHCSIQRKKKYKCNTFVFQNKINMFYFWQVSFPKCITFPWRFHKIGKLSRILFRTKFLSQLPFRCCWRISTHVHDPALMFTMNSFKETLSNVLHEISQEKLESNFTSEPL